MKLKITDIDNKAQGEIDLAAGVDVEIKLKN